MHDVLKTKGYPSIDGKFYYFANLVTDGVFNSTTSCKTLMGFIILICWTLHLEGEAEMNGCDKKETVGMALLTLVIVCSGHHNQVLSMKY